LSSAGTPWPGASARPRPVPGRRFLPNPPTQIGLLGMRGFRGSGPADHEPDLRPGTVLRTSGDEVHSVAFDPDGRMLAAGGRCGEIRLYEIAAAKELATLSGHAGWIISLAYSLDGKTLASASHDGTVKIWDVATGWEMATFPRAQAPPGAAAFAPD